MPDRTVSVCRLAGRLGSEFSKYLQLVWEPHFQQVLDMEKDTLLRTVSYLNLGMGKACMGQSNVKVAFPLP